MKKQNIMVALGVVLTGGLGQSVLALDYEAKPIKWCLEAPLRTVGAVTSGIFCGAVSGPIDGGYHGALKGTKHFAAKFGNENGTAELLAAAPIGGTLGLFAGGLHGVYSGLTHGTRVGWEKPFNRKSYLMEEE